MYLFIIMDVSIEDSAEAVTLISVFLLILSFSIKFTQTKDAVLFNVFLLHNPSLNHANQPWSGTSV